jgi:hypothetical protein
MAPSSLIKYRFSYVETVTITKSIEIQLDADHDPEQFADQLWYLRNLVNWVRVIEEPDIDSEVNIDIHYEKL